jgi:hypothetical protein
LKLACTIGPESDTILPNRVGNYWDYYLYSENSSVIDSARYIVAKRFSDLSAGDDSTVFGMQWYRLGANPPDGSTLYEIRSTGLFQRGVLAPVDTFLVDTLSYPYPATLGAKGSLVQFGWEQDHYVIDETPEVELIDSAVILDTPAGIFSTHVYRWILPPPADVGFGNWIYDYYAPGYGFISRELRRRFSLEVINSWKLERLCIRQYISSTDS